MCEKNSIVAHVPIFFSTNTTYATSHLSFMSLYKSSCRLRNFTNLTSLYCAIVMVRFMSINCLIYACPNIEGLITMTSCSISPWIYPTHNVLHKTLTPSRWHYVPPNQTYSTSISCNLWHLLSASILQTTRPWIWHDHLLYHSVLMTLHTSHLLWH